MRVSYGEDFVQLSRECYSRAAARFGFDPSRAAWEINNPGTRLLTFTGDVLAAGLGTTWVSLPAFYRLMTARVHFRAVSTFSWWAATLGNARVFSPVIRGMARNVVHDDCEFVEGNWPIMSDNAPNTDLNLKEE